MERLVFIDTSFLLAALRQRIDFQLEISRILPGRVRIVVLDVVAFELQRLARRADWKTSRLARVALSMIEREVIESSDSQIAFADADTSILASALIERRHVTVATLDAEFRRLLKLNGVACLSVEDRSRLSLSLAARSADLNIGEPLREDG